MPHRRILLVNPPLVGGVAFTRQGRCQEREEVLGTTKPPYSLLVIAALLREQGGVSLRLVDLTAEGRTTASLVDELKRDGFTPELVVFPSTTPTLHADTAEMVALKRAFGGTLVCFGPHASTVPVEAIAFGYFDEDGARRPTAGARVKLAYRLQSTSFGGTPRAELLAEHVEWSA